MPQKYNYELVPGKYGVKVQKAKKVKPDGIVRNLFRVGYWFYGKAKMKRQISTMK